MDDRKKIYLDDAIDAINDLPNCPNGYSGTYDKASIISALEEVPPAQPEPDNLHPKVDPNFLSCSHCVHSEDSEEICILRKCVHAIAELKECYIERRQNGR